MSISKSLTSCIICNQDTIGTANYCKKHNRALERLREGYELWRKALDELPMNEYLDRIMNNPFTGIWVQEVIESLIVHPELCKELME